MSSSCGVFGPMVVLSAPAIPLVDHGVVRFCSYQLENNYVKQCSAKHVTSHPAQLCTRCLKCLTESLSQIKMCFSVSFLLTFSLQNDECNGVFKLRFFKFDLTSVFKAGMGERTLWQNDRKRSWYRVVLWNIFQHVVDSGLLTPHPKLLSFSDMIRCLSPLMTLPVKITTKKMPARSSWLIIMYLSVRNVSAGLSSSRKSKLRNCCYNLT